MKLVNELDWDSSVHSGGNLVVNTSDGNNSDKSHPARGGLVNNVNNLPAGDSLGVYNMCVLPVEASHSVSIVNSAPAVVSLGISDTNESPAVDGLGVCHTNVNPSNRQSGCGGVPCVGPNRYWEIDQSVSEPEPLQVCDVQGRFRKSSTFGLTPCMHPAQF